MAKKILLAEDSITMQKVVEMTFAAEGFKVTAVSTGDEAIKQAKELKPDIVIADLSMEGKDGYDVCTAVKADPDLASIPVLLLHGSSTPVSQSKATAAKADGDIGKPFETQALIDKVKDLASGAPAKEAKEPIGPIESLAPPMGGDDIVIDTDTFDEPAKPAEKPAIAKPVVAKPAPPKPAPPKPAPPKPVAPKAAKPVAPPKAAPKPAAPKPPLKPALKPQPPKKAPKPTPPPKPAPPPAAAEPMEITIEAEPPPAGGSWDGPTFDDPVESRPDATLLGVGDKTPAPPAVELPPPPPGMPLPPAVQAKAPAATPAAAPVAAPPLQPGQPYEPAMYDAISKISREVIEKIVWEVVPDLAEQIIREELDRLVEKRKSS